MQHRALLGWGLLILLIPGWSQAEVNTAWLEKTRKVEAPPEMVERIKQTGWLDLFHTCNSMAMKGGDYLDCIRVEAALLPPLDPSKKAHFGQHYDPYKYFTCRSETDNRNTSCNKFKLRRNEAEPVWPYPDAPPIVWPDAPDPPVYQPWMSSKAYFDALCEREAGKFIYRTVEDVEGIYQVRALIDHQSNDELQDKFVFESPYQQAIDNASNPGFNFLNPGEYLFFETGLYDPRDRLLVQQYYDSSFLSEPPAESKYIRYQGETYQDYKGVKKLYTTELRSQYGYVWRGITRPHDREHAIAGNEVAIIDLASNEILALWRGFVRSGSNKSEKAWWLSGQACPKIHSSSDRLDKFVLSVLRPQKQ
ncbi:MAG: hypothetical protein KDI83_19000 [Gammaproteobacteria bacterium]|nr:hypothetical protein [Gammaproteobacteria bacterium]